MTHPDSLPWSPAAAPIWSLVCHFSGEHRRKRMLLMLRVYCDDTWNDEVFVMGGFMADAANWAAFADDWRDALSRPPIINYFVMNDAMKNRGEFRHLQIEQRDEKISLLNAVISQHSPLEVYSLIPLEPLRRLYENSELQTLMRGLKPRYQKMVIDPYYHALCSVISGIARMQIDRGVSEKIDFIFDEKRRHEPRIRNAWYPIAENQPPEMRQIISSSPLFLDDKDVLPLQAADMAAWHRRQSWRQVVSDTAARRYNRWETPVLPLVYTEKAVSENFQRMTDNARTTFPNPI